MEGAAVGVEGAEADGEERGGRAAFALIAHQQHRQQGFGWRRQWWQVAAATVTARRASRSPPSRTWMRWTRRVRHFGVAWSPSSSGPSACPTQPCSHGQKEHNHHQPPAQLKTDNFFKSKFFFPLIKQVPPMSPRRLSFIPCLSIPAFTGYMLPSYLCISRSTIGMLEKSSSGAV